MTRILKALESVFITIRAERAFRQALIAAAGARQRRTGDKSWSASRIIHEDVLAKSADVLLVYKTITRGRGKYSRRNDR